MIQRRTFLKTMGIATVSLSAADLAQLNRAGMKIGLVTYLWGKDWDLPTILRNCETCSIDGVELRTEHRHGVEPSLNSIQRKEVKKRFSDSPVTLVGYGSNAQFDSPDPVELKKNITLAKDLLQLSHDVGGSGVKVKPNMFHEGVPHSTTIRQIGESLNELGKFAENLGQRVRLEVHGKETQELTNIKAMLDVARHSHVGICWNCNPEDMNGKGFAYNFKLVSDRLGETIHIHELNSGSNYPYKDLVRMLKEKNYSGWLLLECSSDPADKVKALEEQRIAWEGLLREA